MPRSHRPRKRYTPRALQHDPVEAAIARAALVPKSSSAPIIYSIRAAIDGLRTGTGGMRAWADLADAMNVAEALAELRIANDHASTILEGQRALAALHERHEQRASWTLRADELLALRAAAEIAEIQLEHCTQGELEAAIGNVKRRIAQALAGNASPAAMVCVAGALGTPGLESAAC